MSSLSALPDSPPSPSSEAAPSLPRGGSSSQRVRADETARCRDQFVGAGIRGPATLVSRPGIPGALANPAAACRVQTYEHRTLARYRLAAVRLEAGATLNAAGAKMIRNLPEGAFAAFRDDALTAGTRLHAMFTRWAEQNDRSRGAESVPAFLLAVAVDYGLFVAASRSAFVGAYPSPQALVGMRAGGSQPPNTVDAHRVVPGSQIVLPLLRGSDGWRVQSDVLAEPAPPATAVVDPVDLTEVISANAADYANLVLVVDTTTSMEDDWAALAERVDDYAVGKERIVVFTYGDRSVAGPFIFGGSEARARLGELMREVGRKISGYGTPGRLHEVEAQGQRFTVAGGGDEPECRHAASIHALEWLRGVRARYLPEQTLTINIGDAASHSDGPSAAQVAVAAGNTAHLDIRLDRSEQSTDR